MRAQPDDNFINPLTGLRFVAAVTVAIGHAAPSLRDDWLGHLVAQVASIGMTLFFVLSGFVLWFTYADRMLKSPSATLRDFAAARFARLYPMYVLVVVVITGYLVIRRNQDPAALVFVLTMTQAWFPVFNGTMLAAAISSLEHLWSISVELFFYLLFPLICFSFGRIERISTLAWVSLLNLVVFAIAIAWCFSDGDVFLRTLVPSLDHDGMAWLTYYSPYLHVSQFLAGCLTAQIYMKLAPRRRRAAPAGHVRLLAVGHRPAGRTASAVYPTFLADRVTLHRAWRPARRSRLLLDHHPGGRPLRPRAISRLQAVGSRRRMQLFDLFAASVHFLVCADRKIRLCRHPGVHRAADLLRRDHDGLRLVLLQDCRTASESTAAAGITKQVSERQRRRKYASYAVTRWVSVTVHQMGRVAGRAPRGVDDFSDDVRDISNIEIFMAIYR
jgi:hypothetical protein